MLLRTHLVMGLVVILGFSTAALSGWRLFPAARPGFGIFPGARGPVIYPAGGGHHSGGGYHSTWHGGK